MQELLRTNDPVEISWVSALLAASGIEVILFDSHTSIMEGSIGILPRRLMVLDEDFNHARSLLNSANRAPSQ